MDLTVDLRNKQVVVDGAVVYTLRRNFHLYDVKDPRTNQYVITNVPKDDLERTLEEHFRVATHR